eukprot:scaffold257250_cov18-Prasinocladus_malaysianus.AAC.1
MLNLTNKNCQQNDGNTEGSSKRLNGNDENHKVLFVSEAKQLPNNNHHGKEMLSQQTYHCSVTKEGGNGKSKICSAFNDNSISNKGLPGIHATGTFFTTVKHEKITVFAW